METCGAREEPEDMSWSPISCSATLLESARMALIHLYLPSSFLCSAAMLNYQMWWFRSDDRKAGVARMLRPKRSDSEYARRSIGERRKVLLVRNAKDVFAKVYHSLGVKLSAFTPETPKLLTYIRSHPNHQTTTLRRRALCVSIIS